MAHDPSKHARAGRARCVGASATGSTAGMHLRSTGQRHGILHGLARRTAPQKQGAAQEPRKRLAHKKSPAETGPVTWVKRLTVGGMVRRTARRTSEPAA